MATASEIVTESFELAQLYATDARNSLTTYLNGLNALNYSAPTVTVTWNSIAAPVLPDVPDIPTLPVIEAAVISSPSDFTETAPTFTIDSVFEAAPEVTLPEAPTLIFGEAPEVPVIGEVAIPDVPTYTMPNAPTLLSVGTATLNDADFREDQHEALLAAPTLTLVSPTPYSYTQSEEYTSSLLAALKDKMGARLQGGTGLSAEVEQAIWDRARSRENSVSLGNELEVLRTSEGLGFKLPAGVTAAQLRSAQLETSSKNSSLSRDIAVKQAELEQTNMKEAIAEGVGLESKLIDYSFQLERLTFESAKEAATNAVEVQNLAVRQYLGLVSGYEAFVRAYTAVVDSQTKKVEVYKAELQAEQTKAQINSTLVDQYRASIEAVKAQIGIYQVQIEGAKALVDLEKLKVEAVSEQVRAYVAGVNAQTAKIESFKASVQAQGTVVDIYRTKAAAFSSVVGAQTEKAKADLSRYEAAIRAKALEWDGFKSRIEAERARLLALTSQSSSLVDGFRAAASAVEAKANSQARLWETQIKDYEAGQSIVLSASKMNTESFISTRQAQIDSAKVGAQVYAQLTSSAYSIVNASAGISGSGNTSVNYSYGGDVTSDVTPLTVA